MDTFLKYRGKFLLLLIMISAIVVWVLGCSRVRSGVGYGEYVIVEPSQANELQYLLNTALPNTTFLLMDGHYFIDGHLVIRAEGTTIRSLSGNRDAVVLDGRYVGYVLQISAPRATVADITIKRAKYHLIHVVGNGHDAKIKNLHLIDARQQFIKANPSGGNFCDFGWVQNCFFELTDEGRNNVDPQIGGCYTGGVDVLSGRGWTVSDNRFENIYCTNGGLPTHMVLFWQSSRDPVVERNTIINCARGIGFGLGKSRKKRAYEDVNLSESGNAGHFGGRIRQNYIIGMIGKFFDTGIGLESAYGVVVEDNFVYSTGGTFSSIDSRFPASNAVIRNNAVRPGITVREGSAPILENNLILR